MFTQWTVNKKNSFLVSWIFIFGKNYSIIAGCQKYHKPIKFDKNCWCHFFLNLNYFSFLMWTTINFRGTGKLKIKGPGYLQRASDIGFQRYRSTGLGATFIDCHRDRRNFFLKHFFKWENDLNPWHYSSEEPRPTERLLPDGSTRGLVVSKALIPQP